MTNQTWRLLLQCQPAYMVQLNSRTEFIIIFESCVHFVECLRGWGYNAQRHCKVVGSPRLGHMYSGEIVSRT